jgi:ribosomal protein S18 acetylase RimI-like enzyme
MLRAAFEVVSVHGEMAAITRGIQMEPGTHVLTVRAQRSSVLIPASSLTRAAAVSIELYEGPRQPLRSLFQLAEDSDTELDGYIEIGHLLVARMPTTIVGHIQVTGGETSKIVSVAVVNPGRRRGIGTALIRAGLTWLFSRGAARVLVGTASADVDNLRLYQRLGFRLVRVERDAFTPDRGYSPALNVHGIPIRDRVWLSMEAPVRLDDPGGDTNSTRESKEQPLL